MFEIVDGRNVARHPEARLHRFGSFCGGGSKWPGRAIPGITVNAETAESAEKFSMLKTPDL
jgi:hypothetical protein